MDDNLGPSQTFREELINEILKRKKYEGWDFKLAHFFCGYQFSQVLVLQ